MPQTLNLLSLARTSPGEPTVVPGTDLKVRALTKVTQLKLTVPLWLVVLEGDLIIDLPFGDFRNVQQGDSLRLEAGLELTLTPLKETVLLERPS